MRRTKLITRDEVEWLNHEQRIALLRNQIKINMSERKKLFEWCDNNCSDIYHYHDGIFYFLNEADATGFYLKWS